MTDRQKVLRKFPDAVLDYVVRNSYLTREYYRILINSRKTSLAYGRTREEAWKKAVKKL